MLNRVLLIHIQGSRVKHRLRRPVNRLHVRPQSVGPPTKKRLSHLVERTPHFRKATHRLIVLWARPMRILRVLEKDLAHHALGQSTIQSTARLSVVTRSNKKRGRRIVGPADSPVVSISNMTVTVSICLVCLDTARRSPRCVSLLYLTSSFLNCVPYPDCHKASPTLLSSSPISFRVHSQATMLRVAG